MRIKNYVELAKHFIGLDWKKPYIRHGKKFYRPYRNFFASSRSHNDLDTMVDLGYIKRGSENSYGGYTYYMTRHGHDWLGNELGIKIYDEED